MTWEYRGPAWEIKRTKEREAIVGLLEKVPAEKAMGPSAIAKALGKTQPNISMQLRPLLKDGLISSAEEGKYYGKEK